METKRVQQVDWGTQTVVDGNEIETGNTIKRDDKMLITGGSDRRQHHGHADEFNSLRRRRGPG